MKINKTVLFTLLLLSVLLVSCSGTDEHIWLKSPDWSRAAFLGDTTINDPVPMAQDADGTLYFVLFSGLPEEGKNMPVVVARDGDGEPLWTKSLEEYSLHRPDEPQLIWDGEYLQFFWLENDALYMLALDQDANPVGERVRLSGQMVVASYSLSIDADAGHTLWFAGPRKDPGVYALTSLDGNGDILTIDPEGIRIQLRHDHENTLHATWLQYPLGYGRTQILYGAYPAESELVNINPTTLYELSVGPSNGLDGPVLGIDNDSAYLFWTVSVRSGLEAGAVQTSYMHFPLDDVAQISAPQSIVVPSDYNLEFEPMAKESLHAGMRAILANTQGFRTSELEEFAPNSLQSGELGVLFRSPTQHLWRKVKNQVNMVYFDEGQATSYQPLSFTTTLSTSPNLYNDANGYLYAIWLEKINSQSYVTYFASTAPEIEATLSRSSGRELGRVAAQTAFGMLVGILLAPIAAGVLVIAPLIVIFLLGPLRKIGSTRVQDFFSLVTIVFAILAVWAGKFAVFPGMLDYVPFSAWIPEISAWLGNILRYAVPILGSALAIFVAWFYTYRQSNKSTLYFTLIYVGVDSLVTAAVYAVLIYGAI